MDNSERIILDISSDEDVGWGESGVNFDGGVGCGRDDGDWITELLNEVEKSVDDSDEVMVVGEVISYPKHMLSKCIDNEEDDDDCVVLDGDPDKPVAIENDGGNDSDDLCLVGEKGQVACRDYPHPRHLCVKFPFNSTPHERHCDQCHCYVCDLVAPCVHWGHGVSGIDHCHATEKDEFWKAQRKGAKKSYKAPPFISNVGLTPMNQVSSLSGNPLTHNQELPASQPCPITSTGMPYGVMPVRTQVSGCDPITKFQPRLVSRHIRRQVVGHAGTQFIPQRVRFKRPGMFGGVMTTNRYCNNSSRNSYGYQSSANQSLGSRFQDPREMGDPMLSTYQCTKTNFCGVATNSVPNSSIRSPMGNGIGNYAPSQAQVYTQIHCSSANANSAAPNPQLSSQTCMDSNLGNPMPTVPGVATQQRWGSPLENPMSLQAASQPNVYQNVVPTQSLVNPHGNINYPSESPINFYGETPMSQNSQYLPVECTQLQSAIVGEQPAISINSQWSPISDPHQVDSQFNAWSFGDKSALEDLDIPLSTGYNLFLPESAPMDGGLLFDN